MKTRFFSLIILLIAFGAFALTKFNQIEALQEKQLSDNQIISVIMTIDKNEIDASKEATKKEMGSEATSYAKLLIDQHQKNLDDIKQLAKQLNLDPKESDVSKSLKEGGKQDLKKLEKAKGKEFERLYIETMIKGHKDGLQLIRNTLLSQTQNVQLQAFVEEFQNLVSYHLEKAYEVQSVL